MFTFLHAQPNFMNITRPFAQILPNPWQSDDDGPMFDMSDMARMFIKEHMAKNEVGFVLKAVPKKISPH